MNLHPIRPVTGLAFGALLTVLGSSLAPLVSIGARRTRSAVLTGLVLFGLASVAQGASITRTFAFVASGFFTSIGEETPPQDPVVGRFTVT